LQRRQAADRIAQSTPSERIRLATAGADIGGDRATQLLDEISDDSNMPVYTRTQVWNIVTLLESLLKE